MTYFIFNDRINFIHTYYLQCVNNQVYMKTFKALGAKPVSSTLFSILFIYNLNNIFFNKINITN